MVVSRGVSLGTVGKLLLYALPYFFVFTVPMATLLGILLGFMRMSTDNEVTRPQSLGEWGSCGFCRPWRAWPSWHGWPPKF